MDQATVALIGISLMFLLIVLIHWLAATSINSSIGPEEFLSDVTEIHYLALGLSVGAAVMVLVMS